MSGSAVLILLLAGLCCVDSYSLHAPVTIHRRPASSPRALLSPRARETAQTISSVPGELRTSPNTQDHQLSLSAVSRPKGRRFESQRAPETVFSRPGAVKPAGSLSSRPGSRRWPVPVSVRPAISVIPGSRRSRRYGSSLRAPSVRPGASVVPGSRRGRYGFQRAPATLFDRRDASTLPDSNPPASSVAGSRRGVSITPSSGRSNRPVTSLQQSSLPPLPPVYRNLCRRRRPAALSRLPAPLRSVCRDYWRRRGRPVPPVLPAGERYIGPEPLTARRRRHRTPPPAVAAGPPPPADTGRFYRPYWPYKKDGQRYY